MNLLKSVLAATTMLMVSATIPFSAALAARTDIVVGIVLEPPHLDPTAGAAAAIDEVVYANIFEGLTRIGATGEVLPDLAERWDISEDGKVYTFFLRQNVQFHDGTGFDAEDVKFSLDRARADDSVNAQKVLFAAIDSVDVIDPATVKVTLKHPQGSFLYNLGWGDAVIVAPESAATNKEAPVGTGPFRFDGWAHGTAIRMVKNSKYWGEPIYLEKAEFRIVPDAAAAIPALLSGDVQAFPQMPAGDALSQLETDTRFKVVIGSTEGETIMAMNNARKPFDDIRVRRALSYAIDRASVILGASTNGLGVPIGSHFSPGNEAYEDLTGQYPHDLAKAKALLAEAGYPDGFSATIKLPPTPYARDGGEIIASQLREIGVKLEIIPMEWAQWLTQVFNDKDFDLTIISHTEPNDIDIYARDDYYFGYHSARFKSVMQALDQTSDQQARNGLYREAQRIIADDAVNVFLFQLPKVGVWDAKLEGLWENSPIQANDLTKVRWTD